NLFNLIGDPALLRFLGAVSQLHAASLGIEGKNGFFEIGSISLNRPNRSVSLSPLHENCCINGSQNRRRAEDRVSAASLTLAPVVNHQDVSTGIPSDREKWIKRRQYLHVIVGILHSGHSKERVYDHEHGMERLAEPSEVCDRILG